MRSNQILTRALVLSGCLLSSAAYLAGATKSEPIPLRVPIEEFPFKVASWNGTRAADLEPDVLAALGVDEYVNRVYRTRTGSTAGLYIGYYKSQRQGDTMHSPLNCLPGSGWTPLNNGRITVDLAAPSADTSARSLPSSPVEINRYVVQKGSDTLMVLYWYQSHGRVVASEYWGKFYLVLDALRINRTDGALVRIIVPTDTSDNATHRAEEQGTTFVRDIFPLLTRHLPL